MTARPRLLATFAAASLLLGNASAAYARQEVDAGALQERIRAKLDSLHAAGRFPGAVVGVALPDGRSFGVAVGLSDTATREPLRSDHRMLQGSVGKTYFAALALQLVRDGKLSLDDRVAKYLDSEPWWRSADGRVRLPNGEQITVRHLMTHTSGVVRYEFQQAFYRDLAVDPLREWTPAERLKYVLDSRPPFAAGEGWEYSDTNYILLGMILEKITGTRAYDEIAERILRPLSLANTIPSDRPVLAGVAQGYAGPNNPFGGSDAMIANGRFTVNPQLEWAGGGFASTAEDLARWGKLLFEGRAYGADMLRLAVSGVPARGLGAGARYGLGVIVQDTPLGVSYGHSGFFPGYLTELRYFPEHRFAVAVQFNTSVARAIGRSPALVAQDLSDVVARALP